MLMAFLHMYESIIRVHPTVVQPVQVSLSLDQLSIQAPADSTCPFGLSRSRESWGQKISSAFSDHASVPLTILNEFVLEDMTESRLECTDMAVRFVQKVHRLAALGVIVVSSGSGHARLSRTAIASRPVMHIIAGQAPCVQLCMLALGINLLRILDHLVLSHFPGRTSLERDNAVEDAACF
jgi:hypothetical protein